MKDKKNKVIKQYYNIDILENYYKIYNISYIL